MSKDYECRINHTVSQGETTITIRLRQEPPYTRGNTMTIRRAKRADTAALRALKRFLGV